MTEPDPTRPPAHDIAAPAATEAKPTPEEQRAVAEVLAGEYGLLTAALGAAWSASLTRTSLFLFSLSASGVALGFAAQGGVGTFRLLVLIVTPLLLFLGIATFIRVVQVQRESVIYITGMNRIRHFFAENAPAARPYLVLPIYDDEKALYRSIGTGMSRRPPRNRIVYLLVQTQGIVGVVTAAVAAAFVGLLVAPLGEAAPWVGAAVAFVATVSALFLYWQRSLTELYASIRPLYPTPPDAIDAPF
jgi:hypothetical protein